jgi:hypothetical protein
VLDDEVFPMLLEMFSNDAAMTLFGSGFTAQKAVTIVNLVP